ncbi:MAG: YbaK/EbsC family protein [Clostridium sp.]|mgnify:CR=1 FL=1|nr:YbaK/EbsC family protein [Clostridium sp.]
MTYKLKRSAERVQKVLDEFDLGLQAVELPDSTRTAKEAADAIGCTIGQIVKSLVFRTKISKEPILILVSGKNRVNEKAVKEYIGEKLEKADADFILECTGYAIGGIPPVGHKTPITTYIDEDLMNYDEIWAAAGTPNAVFKLTSGALAKITNGSIIGIK